MYEGPVQDLIDELGKLPGVGPKSAQRIAFHLLSVEPPDLVLLDRILAIVGFDAAAPLLDELATSRSRTVRRALLERLGKMGPAIATDVMARLDDQRWFVVRNLLALLEDWPEHPPEFTAMPYAIHPDPRVRRQALKLQLKMPAEREQAIAGALAFV